MVGDNESEISPSSPAQADFRPTASLESLRVRAGLMAFVRQFFAENGYWEVDTPTLSHDVCVDAYLEPFTSQWYPDGIASEKGATVYLQTSPEFAMKRLLAAGADAIYQLGHVMRNGERGQRHNPEFTMLEWYRVGDDHHAQMDFVERLVAACLQHLASHRTPLPAATDLDGSAVECDASSASTPDRDQDADPDQDSEVAVAPSDWRQAVADATPFERLSYDEAFERYAGQRVLGLTTAELMELADTHGISVPESLSKDDRDGWLNLLLAEVVEPELGLEVPTFVYDYPATQAALARIRNDEYPVAERFELYVQSVELCNGYHELVDADELRSRMEQQRLLREGEGRPELPSENRLLQAMQAGLPNSAGVALGFDRLLMLGLGLESIDDVIAFPFDRA